MEKRTEIAASSSRVVKAPAAALRPLELVPEDRGGLLLSHRIETLPGCGSEISAFCLPRDLRFTPLSRGRAAERPSPPTSLPDLGLVLNGDLYPMKIRAKLANSPGELERACGVSTTPALDLAVRSVHHAILDSRFEDPVAATRGCRATQRAAVGQAALRGAFPGLTTPVEAKAEGDLPTTLTIGFELDAEPVASTLAPGVAPAEGTGFLPCPGHRRTEAELDQHRPDQQNPCRSHRRLDGL